MGGESTVCHLFVSAFNGVWSLFVLLTHPLSLPFLGLNRCLVWCDTTEYSESSMNH
jgi:hypothetical protein